jgi:hypothetical protein
MNKTFKKINNIRNKTKKKQEKILKNFHELTNEDRAALCASSANTYTSFEHKIDEIFKKNNVDILSASFNLEKAVVKELKKAVSPSNIIPQNDYYSYINERWLQDLDIEAYQEYLSQIDNFRLVQDNVYRQLIQIIENYISSNDTKNTKLGKCIKNAYESFKIFNTNEQTKCIH